MSEGDLYHPLIITRNKTPIFYREVQAGVLLNAYNPVCGDDFAIAIQMKNDQIEHITFRGYGCAVSKAAIDLLIERLLGLHVDQAISEINYYLKIIDLDVPPPVEEYPLAVFQKVKYSPSRRECAVLGANSLLAFLNGYKKNKQHDQSSNFSEK
jgi:nitrogen fixation protein NifU and related proteins